jgi:hypothetical protein
MAENKTDCLILIPVHRPKMNWLVSFLNSLALFPMPEHGRILLIASNPNDCAYFTQALAPHPLAKNLLFLDAAEYLQHSFGSDALVKRLRENTDRCAINLKKMAGLHWSLKNGFEYAICLDSDVLAVAGFARIQEVARDNYEEALYLGAGTGGVANRDLLDSIMQGSANLFAPDEQVRIGDITNGFTLYSWFGDMPVYRAADLAAFFAYMETVHGSMTAFLTALRWETFDHMLFVFYRVALRGARIFNYRTELRILTLPEFLKPVDVFKISTATGYEPGWIGAAAAYEHPEAFRILPNLVMLSHFDRL